MYTDEDLELAVEEGIFTRSSVETFRQSVAELKNSPAVDEENFKLISGFNDIFVVIACSLLLFSSLWVVKSLTDSRSLSLLVFTIISWGLAEFFVRKRKMALPAIMLLVSFVGGVFFFIVSIFGGVSEQAFIVASVAAMIATQCHWRRFKVPVTVAVGAASCAVLFSSAIYFFFPNSKEWMEVIAFFFGLLIFLFAMYWDASDTQRTTKRSDVAFWLHLLSAPLIIHPVFSSLGILKGNDGLMLMAIVVALYILMTSISLVIDRRAFMVSSLVYVLYALSNLIENYGVVGSSFALTGFFMGGALLLLSAYWHRVRASVVNKLPNGITAYIPAVRAL